MGWVGVAYGLAVLAKVYGGVVWREGVGSCTNDWARHFGDGAVMGC